MKIRTGKYRGEFGIGASIKRYMGGNYFSLYLFIALWYFEIIFNDYK